MFERTFFPPDIERSEAAFRQTLPYSEAVWRWNYNLDESRVGNFPLPPFESKTVREWEETERPRILQQFKDILYGKMPPAPDTLVTELLAQKDDALDNTAVRKEIRVISRIKDGKYLDFDMLLYVPKKAEVPPPVFVHLNFNGNQACTPETDVRQSRGYRYRDGQFVRQHLRATERGIDALNAAEAVRRGYAVATADYCETCPDWSTGIKIGPMALFYDEKDLRMDYEIPFEESKACKWVRPVSMIGSWAWGLSRMLDALEKEPQVDAKRPAVIGHSRLGKAALWAGACDPRFQLVISNNSGCCGAALSRRNFGENLEISYWEKKTWYCGGLAPFAAHPEKMPIDQHMLLALIAPRTLCVGSASEDLNADPMGEYLATREASSVWTLYGMEGIGNEDFPAPDHGIGNGPVRYWYRAGKHALTPADWKYYYDLADRVFQR